MKIISGGQSGVDRAALDVAIERGLPYGGWCPKGGWAEDFPHPPGVLRLYPLLQETPLADTAQRTEWNIRDADASLILVAAGGLPVSKGTMLACDFARRYGRPFLVVDTSGPSAAAEAAMWLRNFGSAMALGIGGPRESEAPGIYTRSRRLIGEILDHL